MTRLSWTHRLSVGLTLAVVVGASAGCDALPAPGPVPSSAVSGAGAAPSGSAQSGDNAANLAVLKALPAYRVPTSPPTPVPFEAMDRETGAHAVQVFLDAVNYGFARNDADPLRDVSSLGCMGCLGWIKEIDTRARDGRTQRGGAIRLVRANLIEESPQVLTFVVSMVRESGEVRDGNGGVTPIPAGAAELAELQVGPSESMVTGRKTWNVHTMTPAAP